jgi:Flp pilus assembly protein TadD
MGYYELALMDVNKAISIIPGNANYYKLQAFLLEKLGKKEAAKRSLENAAVLER